jgi:branched-chain amino acid transport system substrate-binding protein
VNLRAGASHRFEIVRFDSEGSSEKALLLLRAAIDSGLAFVAQGNSSATAAALVEAIDKHNARTPERRVLLLNYSAVDPALTNERCSPWHFRFDARRQRQRGGEHEPARQAQRRHLAAAP